VRGGLAGPRRHRRDRALAAIPEGATCRIDPFDYALRSDPGKDREDVQLVVRIGKCAIWIPIAMGTDPTLVTAWQVIPTDAALDLPHFSIQVTLDGLVWTLRFQWKCPCPVLDQSISDEADTTVYKAGCRVVLNVPLCEACCGGCSSPGPPPISPG
jgi:hypothetical protein